MSRSTIKIQRILQSVGKFENAQSNDPHLKLLRIEEGAGGGGREVVMKHKEDRFQGVGVGCFLRLVVMFRSPKLEKEEYLIICVLPLANAFVPVL